MRSYENNEDISIPISMLRQFYFCPRIVFFSEFKDIQPVYGEWVNKGMDFHTRQEMLIKRRNLENLGIPKRAKLKTEIKLKSTAYNLHGVCDAAFFFVDQKGNNKIVPLEFKTSEKISFVTGAELQIAAYAMLLEEQYSCTIDEGFILYGSKGKTYSVKINKEMKNKVKNTTARITSMFEMPIIPDSSATEKQCSQCEYLNFCADRY